MSLVTRTFGLIQNAVQLGSFAAILLALSPWIVLVLVAAGLPVWIRTPVIPGYTDAEQNLVGIAAHLKQHVPTVQRYDLLAFSNLCTSKYEMLGRSFPLAGVPLLTRETMEHLTQRVRGEGIEVVRWSGPTRVDAAREAR